MKVIILAAGKGKRLREGEGDLVPKVMKKALGRPLIEYVLGSMDFIPQEDITVVVGFGREQVEKYLSEHGNYATALQAEQLGTGHAVLCAKSGFEGYEGGLLVGAGDMPLVKKDTYRELIATHEKSGNACTILTADAADPTGYGRITRNADGSFRAIVEHRDCTPDELAITEINSAIYVFDAKPLFELLTQVKPANKQGEYYLTDVPGLMLAAGMNVGTYKIASDSELLGINTIEQLTLAEKYLSEKE